MGYNFKYHKNTFYGLNIHPPAMILSRPPWPVFLIDFSLNPPLECKQLRDADSHSRKYSFPTDRWKQILKRCVDKIMEFFFVGLS